MDTFGGVDGLHTNAADLSIIGADSDAVEVPLEIFQRTIEVDLRGYLLLTRYAVPAMLDRGRGAIVCTGSGAAFVGEPERVSYAMAKAGVNALMRHVASKWGKRGIRSNAVAPGLVLTEAVRDPADVAAAVAYLLSDDAEWVVGQVLSIDGATLR